MSGLLFPVGPTAGQARGRSDAWRAGPDWPVVLRVATHDDILEVLAVLAAGRLAVVLPADEQAVPVEPVLALLGRAVVMRGDAATALEVGPAAPLPGEACLALPTSGTTGPPRLALRSSRSLAREAEVYAKSYGLTPDARVAIVASPSHAFGLGVAVAASLVGASWWTVPPAPHALHRGLRDGASWLVTVPAVLQLAVRVRDIAAGVPDRLLVGAGIVSERLAEAAHERFGRLPSLNYGSTETGPTLGTLEERPDGTLTGRALAGVEVHVRGPSGALFVRTDAPFLGYLDERGLDDRSVSPEWWYLTGDRAVLRADGGVEVRGRFDGSARRGGRFLEPWRVEAILREHPAVADVTAVVGGAQDDAWLDVHIELEAGAPPIQAAELRTHVAIRGGEELQPRGVTLHQRLPRGRSGKVDLRALDSAPGEAVLSRALEARRWLGLLGADALGLLDAWAQGTDTVEAARRVGVRVAVAEALFDLARDVGLVGETPDHPGFYARARAVLAYERAWTGTDEALRSWLRGGRDDVSFQEAYAAVFQGLALLAAGRMGAQVGGLRVLEIACPTAALSRRPPVGSHVDAFPLPPHGPVPRPPASGSWDALWIFNATRRLSATTGLGPWISLVRPGGTVIAFEQALDAPPPGVRAWGAVALDWAIDGISRLPRGVDLAAELAAHGLRDLRLHREIPGLTTILATQPLEKSDGTTGSD